MIPAVDFEISGACNLRCPGCWGTPRGLRQSHSNQEWFLLANRLMRIANLKCVTLCGGEPLLVPGIDLLIKRLDDELGLEVYLETNGFLLPQLLPAIHAHLGNISLPLEGSTEETNSYRRGAASFGVVINCLRVLNDRYPGIPVKIGTCVFRANLCDVPNIGDVLLANGFGSRFPDRGVWKLYQITRFGGGADDPQWPDLEISAGDFGRAMLEVGIRYQHKIAITSLATRDTGGYCTIVRPNGQVVANGYSFRGEETLVFPDIFADPEAAVRSILAFQSLSRAHDRLVDSYFFEWEMGRPPTSRDSQSECPRCTDVRGQHA